MERCGRDGREVTFTAGSRNTVGYLKLLGAIDQANPEGDLNLISDNLSSHTSAPIQQWLAAHPRVHPVPLPTGACWLNLQEGWWRLFRREALAGQSFADAKEIDLATRVATEHLNARAKPWMGPPAPSHRLLRRRLYCLEHYQIPADFCYRPPAPVRYSPEGRQANQTQEVPCV